MHCDTIMRMPQSAVMSKQKIMMVIYGDFSKMKGGTTKSSDELPNNVFQILPDVLMTCDTVTFNISSVSKAFSKFWFMK